MESISCSEHGFFAIGTKIYEHYSKYVEVGFRLKAQTMPYPHINCKVDNALISGMREVIENLRMVPKSKGHTAIL